MRSNLAHLAKQTKAAQVQFLRGLEGEQFLFAAGMGLALRRGGSCLYVVSVTTPHQRKIASIVSRLLEWYPKNARDLPWRRTNDPYCVFVSEIMLQQTQVKTVVPYFERWMRALPTIDSLAKARPEKLHKLWEGLGYYTRVRNLQRAARVIVKKHGGKFPSRFEDVLELPGVGRYTAGAICSIAFRQPAPVLDANVIRVLTRVLGIEGNPREARTRERLWQVAEELVQHASRLGSPPDPSPQPSPLRKGRGRSYRLSTYEGATGLSITSGADRGTAGHMGRSTALHGPVSPLSPSEGERAGMRGQVPFEPAGESTSEFTSHLNQALMELGALICRPRAPDCDACPLAERCVAFLHNQIDELPNLSPRARTTHRRFVAFVMEHQGRFLVRQRAAGVVNGHLWEFPNMEVSVANADLKRAARSAVGCNVKILGPLCTIKHSITRFRITLEAFRASLGPVKARDKGVWLPRARLNQLAFASAHKKILERAIVVEK